MDLAGILVALAALVYLAFRGWSVLLLAPATALVAAGFAGEPLLVHWTQTFMGAAGRFIAQFFPLFLMGALFGKLMEDSGAVTAIAQRLTDKLGSERAVLSQLVFPRIDFAFLAEPRFGPTSLAAVGGVWAVAVGLAAAILALSGTRHGESYFDMVMACVVGPLLALVVVIPIGGFVGAF